MQTAWCDFPSKRLPQGRNIKSWGALPLRNLRQVILVVLVASLWIHLPARKHVKYLSSTMPITEIASSVNVRRLRQGADPW